MLRSYLPAGADPELLTRSLKGRWFGNLRWLGRRDAQDETQLLWMTIDPEVEVVLRLMRGEAAVETDAVDQAGMAEAFAGARHIFAQLSGPSDVAEEDLAPSS